MSSPKTGRLAAVHYLKKNAEQSVILTVVITTCENPEDLQRPLLARLPFLQEGHNFGGTVMIAFFQLSGVLGGHVLAC